MSKKTISNLFTVNVIREPETGGWVAFNNELPFAVEGDSFEMILKRAWEIAPEMVIENKHDLKDKPLKLNFLLESEIDLARAI